VQPKKISQDWLVKSYWFQFFEKLLAGYWEGAGTGLSQEEAKFFCWLAAKWLDLLWLAGFGFFTDHLEGNVVLQVALLRTKFPSSEKNQNDFAPKLAVPQNDLELIFSKSPEFRIEILTIQGHFLLFYWEDSGYFVPFLKNQIPWAGFFFSTPKWFLKGEDRQRRALLNKELNHFYVRVNYCQH